MEEHQEVQVERVPGQDEHGRWKQGRHGEIEYSRRVIRKCYGHWVASEGERKPRLQKELYRQLYALEELTSPREVREFLRNESFGEITYTPKMKYFRPVYDGFGFPAEA